MAYTQQTPVGTPDVNLITKTLANLRPDSALQEYAELHKNNVYILSLAKAESDRRKAVRLAAQGNPGQQPSVADQSIAGMAPAPMMAQTQLPENQGIAQIPTPNIQRMADGGIAGYEDDEEGMATGGMGGMFNFAQQSEPVVRMSGGGHIPRYQGTPRSIGGDGSVVSSNPMFNIPNFQAVTPRETFTQEGSPENQTMFERLSGYLGEKKKQATLSEIAYRIHTGIATEQEKAFYQAEMTKKPGQKQMGAPKDVVNPDEVLMANEKAGKFKTAADKVAADKAPSAAPAPQAALPTGIATIKQPTAEDATAASNKFFDADALTRRLDQQRMQERQDIAGQKETRLAQLDAFNKEKGPAFAGYEKLLQKEELQDATDKEKAGLMSLMKGFLAMAGGESPNAATNIAKGAMAGLGDYGDALKEFKKAAKERTKAMADIEQARRAEARGDLKDTQMFEEKADTRMAESDRAFTNAVTQITGKKGEIASGIFKDLVNNAEATKRTMIQESGANARTNAQLNAKGQTERLVDRMTTDPKFAESYKNFASIGPEAKGVEAELQAYLKNPMVIKATNPELAAYYDQLIKQRRLQPTSTPTGQVLVGQ
jgi:hypothetical protein